MDIVRDQEKQTLEVRLAACRALAKDFRNGPTAEMIRELEYEIRKRLQQLEWS
jgi:hypothetical protein